MSKHLFKSGDRIAWQKGYIQSNSFVNYGTVESVSPSGLMLSVRWDSGKFSIVRAVDVAPHVTPAG